MLGRIRHMLKKEFIQVLRDPRTRFIIFGVPIIQTIVFGYAVTTDVRDVQTAVYDQDNTVASRELVARFVASGYFQVVERIEDDDGARRLLDAGRVSAVIQVNHGFQADLIAGKQAEIQLLIDGTDSNTARIVGDYAMRITADLADTVLVTRATMLNGSYSRPGHVELQSRAWFNDNLLSRNFYIPGVIALMVTLVTLLLTSMSVVREKESGTIEQIAVTPIRPYEFILGKTVPFALLGFIDVLAVCAVAVFWFGIPIHGRLGWLLLGGAIYMVSSLGLGLLISTIARTQQQAMMTTFMFFMPATLLSGFIFPIANMPTVVQWLTYANPLRYFIVIIRGVFLKGVGIEVLWPQMLALLAVGLITLTIASRRFHKTLG
ncbi:MAG: ABC transporter permease [Phycisphaerae bacterium]|nr:ABC transporter permease [Phycisphaerae bacterium]